MISFILSPAEGSQSYLQRLIEHTLLHISTSDMQARIDSHSLSSSRQIETSFLSGSSRAPSDVNPSRTQLWHTDNSIDQISCTWQCLGWENLFKPRVIVNSFLKLCLFPLAGGIAGRLDLLRMCNKVHRVIVELVSRKLSMNQWLAKSSKIRWGPTAETNSNIFWHRLQQMDREKLKADQKQWKITS